MALAQVAAEAPGAARAEPWSGDAALEAALAALPEPFREVVLLRYYGSCSCSEVAARLGLPIGTVTKRLSRAYEEIDTPWRSEIRNRNTHVLREVTREDLIAVLESTATPAAVEAVRKHLDACEACRAEMQQYRALRSRLEASAAAAAQPALENQVMARVPRTGPGVPPAEGLAGWLSRLYLGARAWRLALGTAGLAAVLVAAAVLFFHEPSQAWSIEQSIAATRPFQALHLRGTSRRRLALRTVGPDRHEPAAPRQRLLMRIHRALNGLDRGQRDATTTSLAAESYTPTMH